MYSSVQETQPPGQVLNGRHFLTPTITPGSTRPSIYVITLTPEHKILLVGDIFSLGSTNNNHPRVVPGNINCHKLKVLLVGDIFILGSTNNNRPRVVPGNINCHKSYMALLVNYWSR